MRLKLKELESKLYVFRDLTPYDTAQWSVFSDEVGATCSAEVRVEGYGDDIDALEAQVVVSYDEPPAGMPELVQIFYLKATHQKTGDFKVVEASIKSEDKINSDIYNWGEKMCKFFTLIAQELEQGNLPDFDELEKEAFEEDGIFADRWGDGGGRSPKINTEQLLKAGRGF